MITLPYRPMPMPGGAFSMSRRRNERRPQGFRRIEAALIAAWEAEGGALARERLTGAGI